MEESSSAEEQRAWGKAVGDEVEMKAHKGHMCWGVSISPCRDRSHWWAGPWNWGCCQCSWVSSRLPQALVASSPSHSQPPGSLSAWRTALSGPPHPVSWQHRSLASSALTTFPLLHLDNPFLLLDPESLGLWSLQQWHSCRLPQGPFLPPSKPQWDLHSFTLPSLPVLRPFWALLPTLPHQNPMGISPANLNNPLLLLVFNFVPFTGWRKWNKLG